MFEKYVYLTLIKGGQEKENHSQHALNGQILKICIVKICFCRHIGAMWLSFIWLPVKNMQKWYIIFIINWVFFLTCY